MGTPKGTSPGNSRENFWQAGPGVEWLWGDSGSLGMEEAE